MKWDEEPDPDDADEDDIAEFDKMRKASHSYTAISIWTSSIETILGPACFLGFHSLD
jgi:hypothetical protein